MDKSIIPAFSEWDKNNALIKALDLYLLECEATLRPATHKVYKESLNVLGAFLPINTVIIEIDEILLIKWISSLVAVRDLFEKHPKTRTIKAAYSPSTVLKHIGHVSTFLNWCVRRRIMEENPLKHLRKPKRPINPPKATTTAAITALLVSIERADYKKGYTRLEAKQYRARNNAIIHFLRSTGCRSAGLINATVKDMEINLADGHVILHEKNQISRYGILDKDACWAMRKWLAEHPTLHPKHNVFVSLRGKSYGEGLTQSGLSSFLTRAARRMQIEDRTNPHSFRHYAITEWVGKLNVGEASQLAGHSSVKVTIDVYARYDLRRLREAHKRASTN